MILNGYVTSNNQIPIANAVLEIKGDDFVTIYHTQSDETGYYQFDIPAGQFLTAVKEYGVNNLEYWCQNIDLQNDLSLDVSFGKLEVYGLHVFPVKGSGNGLMVYFRPMSLDKFQRGEQDIVPDGISIRVTLDETEVSVAAVNRVTEIAADRKMTAFLIQIDSANHSPSWKKLDLQITDSDNHYGAVSIFNDLR